MPTGSRDDCHLCHIHDHNHPSSLLRTTTLRENSPPPRPRRHSRSGSIDRQYHDHGSHHHSHHHHKHDRDRHHHHHSNGRSGRVPSALARLSEHASHSLPASRSNTLNLYPEQISVLPDGGHRYLGGDRTSVRSLELTSPRNAPDNRSHLSLHQTTTMQKQSSPDILTTTLPPLRPHGSHLSLNHATGLSPPQDQVPDFFLPVNRLPAFKDTGRKHRFNLQTVMLIGCYSLLFVMAIIIGVVLCHQNGWLGFGTPEPIENNVENSSGRPLGSVGGKVLDNRLRNGENGNQNKDLNGKLREDINRNNNQQIPVHNVVQVRNPNSPNLNVAGVLPNSGDGQPRSISGSGRRNELGNRPIQITGDGTNNQNNVRNVGVPLPTLISPSPEVPVPSLISPSGTNQQNGQFNTNLQQGQGTNNGFNKNGGLQPNSQGPTSVSNQNPSQVILVPSNTNQNLQNSNVSPEFMTLIKNSMNQMSKAPGNLTFSQPIQNPSNPVSGFPNPALVNGNNQQPVFVSQNVNGNPVLATSNAQTPQQILINPNSPLSSNILSQLSFNKPTSQHIQIPNNFKLIEDSNIQQIPIVEDQPLNLHAVASNAKANDNNNKNSDSHVNQINMEKMKMLKEILDAEGSGKLLQDLITIKNNRNSLTAISQHLSETTNGHGPSPAIHSPSPQRNIASVASPAILQHKNTFNTTSALFINKNQTPTPEIPAHFRTPTRQSVSARQPSKVVAETEKPKKNNIQVVRELLASLINSPEVQQILTSRNKQAAKTTPTTGRGFRNPRVNTKQGDEMRQLLLKALAKELPNGQSVQNLRLHGPRPSIGRQTIQAAQNNIRRQKASQTGKITRAMQLGHFDTTSRNKPRGILPPRTLQSRMGKAPATPKQKRTSREHVSVKPPVTTKSRVRTTSRGRRKPRPNFRLKVKSDGKSPTTKTDADGKEKKVMVTESVDIRMGKDVKPEGESEDVVRVWHHMDQEGTMSQGTVRSDGSFAFTNCRPIEMCKDKS